MLFCTEGKGSITRPILNHNRLTIHDCQCKIWCFLQAVHSWEAKGDNCHKRFETRPWVTPTLNPCKNSYDKHFANGITYLQVVLIRKARVVIAARDFETRPQVTPAGCQALLMITAKPFWRRYYVPACISYKESESGNCRQDKTSSNAS